METFIKVVKIIGTVLIKTFEVGMFVCCAIMTERELYEYLTSEDE